MARTQKTILGPAERVMQQASRPGQVKEAVKELITEVARTHQIMRDDVVAVEDRAAALESKFTGAETGWFDDGANFRVTVTNGIITAIGDSIAAGHS